MEVKEVKKVKKIYDFLSKTNCFFLATVENDQPRVRPMGTLFYYENKIYFLTAKTKDVSMQITNNPKFELVGMDSNERWIRVCGKIFEDTRVEMQQAILDNFPHLKDVYTAGDGNLKTYYFDELKASVYSYILTPAIDPSKVEL